MLTPIESVWPRPCPGAAASAIVPDSFGVLLGRLRRQAGLSQNALAREARLDPAYVNRLEQRRDLGTGRPSRRIILALVQACHAADDDRERLLVAAGLCPEAIILAGGWDAYVAGWFESLEQPHRSHFRVLERRLDLARAALREQSRRIARLRLALAEDLVRLED